LPLPTDVSKLFMLSPAPVSLSQAACFHCNLLHSITPAKLAFVL